MGRVASTVNRFRRGHVVAWIVAALAMTMAGFYAVSQLTQPSQSSTVVAGPDDEPTSAPPTTTPRVPPPVAVVPPADLPVIDYWPGPTGFPADPAPMSMARLTEALRPIGRIAAYDAAGGAPMAFLDPTIRGVEIALPIVERRSGWVSVLLPSVNRTVAWIPSGLWVTTRLRDQLVVVRSTHELQWFRDGEFVRSWSVSLGTDATPTPLGRTFVLGRSALPGYVYADTDVFALGAVPDDPAAIPPGLLGAHIGVHTWYHDGELGQNTTDGCIRLTRSGQELLLSEIAPGTEVVVVDQPDSPPAGLRAPGRTVTP